MYFDIGSGSNNGMWSLANYYNCDKIIAIEASPSKFIKLLENCGNQTKMKCIHFTVCDNNSNNNSNNNKDGEIICKSITIDNLIEKYGVPSLIKIDVEGGEYECIKSLTKKVDNLCFEWTSETYNITLMCLEYLIKLEFTLFFVQLQDNFIFRPHVDNYYTIDDVKKILNETIQKKYRGVIWCK